MKRLSIIFVFMLLLFSLMAIGSSAAKNYTECGVTYKLYSYTETGVDSNYAVAYSVSGDADGEIVIPSIVNKAYPVTSMASGFAKNNSTITSVTLCERFTEIPSSAFSGCKVLETVNIPDTVTVIGESAFSGCASLKSIHIPDSVTRIGRSAFAYCALLEDINIPKGVTVINSHTFSSCTSLESIKLHDGVTDIYDRAFYGCTKLVDIGEAKNVEQLGVDVFHKSAFNNIYGTVYVGKYLFSYADDDKVFTVRPGTTKIHKYAFWNTSGLKKLEKVILPEGVTVIEDYAFKDCLALKEVVFPSTLKRIGRYAFEGCDQMIKAHLPEGLTDIWYGAFVGCTSLKDITIPGTVTDFYTDTFEPEVCTEYRGGLYIGDWLVDIKYGSSYDVFYIKEGTRYTADIRWEGEEALFVIIPSSLKICRVSGGSEPKHLFPGVFLICPNDTQCEFNPWENNNTRNMTMHSFKDTSRNQWYSPVVTYAVNMGYMKGVGENKFNPTGTVTREQFIQVLYNIYGYKGDFSGATGFSDVPEGEWYSAAIKWAHDKGYTVGIGGGKFGLGQSITREEVAVLISSMASGTIYGIELKFNDMDQISDWAFDGVKKVYQTLIMVGDDKGNFNPKKHITRVELARICYNLTDPDHEYNGS